MRFASLTQFTVTGGGGDEATQLVAAPSGLVFGGFKPSDYELALLTPGGGQVTASLTTTAGTFGPGAVTDGTHIYLVGNGVQYEIDPSTLAVINSWTYNTTGLQLTGRCIYGPDDNLWNCNNASNDIVKLLKGVANPTKVTVAVGSGVTQDICTDGTYLWVTTQGGNVFRVTTAGVVTAFALRAASVIYSICYNPDDGFVYATDTDAGHNGVWQIATPSGVATFYPGGSTAMIGAAPTLGGGVWCSDNASGGGYVYQMSTAGIFTQWESPAGGTIVSGEAIVLGPDGNPWVGDSTSGIVYQCVQALPTNQIVMIL